MVEIFSTRLHLREFRASDLRDSMTIVGDDRVTRWLSFDSVTSDDQAERLSAAMERAASTPRTEYYLAVTTRLEDRLIGFARLGLGGVRAAELGYAIAAERWGNGYATEAACALVDHGFTTLALHRITAAVGPDNVASLALLRGMGFVEEGRLRDHVFTNGAWRDSLLFAILAPDWMVRTGPRARCARR